VIVAESDAVVTARWNGFFIRVEAVLEVLGKMASQ
jgi:hypothetical protein